MGDGFMCGGARALEVERGSIEVQCRANQAES